jgi:hypothetical protein
MEDLHDIRVRPSGNDVLSVTRNLVVALQYLSTCQKGARSYRLKPSMVGGDEPDSTDSKQTVTVRGQGAGCHILSASSLVV